MSENNNIDQSEVNDNVTIPGWGVLPAKNIKDEIEQRIFDVLIQVKNRNFTNVYYDLFQNRLLETFIIAQLGSVEKNLAFYCAIHKEPKDVRDVKFAPDCGECLSELLNENIYQGKGDVEC